MSFSILPFDAARHAEGAVHTLRELRATVDYPPERDSAGSIESLRAWLSGDDPLASWVAVEGQQVVGHVQVTEPHAYLSPHVGQGARNGRAVLEVGKLFVSPHHQGSGIGAGLLRRACEFIADRGALPALCVLPSSKEAIRLYQRAGLAEVARFDGLHGVNIVMMPGAGATDDTDRLAH